jgi:hypothetical protein
MSATGSGLLAAAAGVGFGHAILPEHSVPLAVLGRDRRYPLSRVARLGGLPAVMVPVRPGASPDVNFPRVPGRDYRWRRDRGWLGGGLRPGHDRQQSWA